ncbi:MAG: hypothetical protein AMXMBFR47_23490 [Planctomycetota bacterium]
MNAAAGIRRNRLDYREMPIPSPRAVFDDPAAHWTFLTQPRDDDFEGQYFDRKIAGQANVDPSTLRKQLKEVRDEITEVVSGFAQRNKSGGCLVLGIASNGDVVGLDHLSESQRNSLTDIGALLHHQAAEVKLHHANDATGNPKLICLIFVPYTDNGICETPGTHPKA